MRPILSLPIAAAIALLAAACLPTDVCGCTPLDPELVLDGRVEDPDGAPVPGAGVLMDYGEQACDGVARNSIALAETRSDGTWESVLSWAPAPVCILLRAAGPAGSGLGTGEALLRHTSESPLPYGMDPETSRVQVTIRLPAADGP